MLKVGFTGSRRGLTPAQKNCFADLVEKYAPFELHHGDCVGADEYAHEWYFYYGHGDKNIVVHPPINDRLRAFCGVSKLFGTFVSVREPKEYLERNKDIVDETDFLIGFPNRDPSGKNMMGGTWHAIRYAKSVGKKVIIVYADGSQSILDSQPLL